MKVFQKPDGSLLVPTRAEGPDGLIGDGYTELKEGTEQHKVWMEWMEKVGEEPEQIDDEQAEKI